MVYSLAPDIPEPAIAVNGYNVAFTIAINAIMARGGEPYSVRVFLSVAKRQSFADAARYHFQKPFRLSVDKGRHEPAGQGEDQVGDQDDDQQHAEHRQQDHRDIPQRVDHPDLSD